MQCGAENFKNFLLIDDNDKEHEVNIVEKEKEVDVPNTTASNTPTREGMLEILEHIINSYEELPPQAKESPVTNYEMHSALVLILCILKLER